MFIEEKIASIKSKYKELYKVDVDIQYNKETGEYILIDDDKEVVKTIKSLDEELLELEKSKSYDDGVYRDYSGESHDGEERRNNNKIDIYYSKMISVINAINTMAGSIGSVDTSYASSLTGELRAYYDSLGDNTPEAVRNLAGSIMGVAAATETSVSLCYNVGKENLKELEELINEFYQYAKEMSEKSQIAFDSEEPLSYDNYTYVFDNLDEMFEGRYEDIINRFKYNLAIGYQNFLKDTVPETIDNIIENTYLRISEEEIGSSKYQEGLNEFKESFGLKVLNEFKPKDFKIEDSNIPEYLWKDADNYHKSLLMLSYNNDNFSNVYMNTLKDSINYACNTTGVYIKDIPTFEHDINEAVAGFKRVNDYYQKDYDKELSGLSNEKKIKKILEITKEIRKPYDEENGRVSHYTMESARFPNLGGNIDNDKCWLDSLKEFGYLGKLSNKYEDKVLYENTFNYEFLTNIAINEGTDKVYQIIEKYYDNCYKEYNDQNSSQKAKLLARDLFQETPFASNFTTANMTLGVINNLNYNYEKLSNDFITIEATKSNFKLGLLERLDTSGITESDVIKAREIIGNDAKYLEDWQIKGYYKIYQSDKERASKLLNDTLNYHIQNGRGYEKAKNVYNTMTGENQKKILQGIIHDDVFNEIFGKTSGFVYTGLQGFTDGIIGSIRNVADAFLEDGKMDSEDYYRSYLQEMLSSGGAHNFLLKNEYNITSSVGNMAIPMALSAFISPHAMSAWIFASTVGSEREQTLRSGKEETAATWFNAVAKGLVAVGVERVLGSLKGYGAKEGKVLDVFTSDGKIMEILRETGLDKMISESVNETIEELVENVSGYGIDFLTGEGIDLGNVPKETWETIYMTMLTTPLINLMGGSFQNSKYSAINRLHTYNFDGYEVKYSKAELMQFTDKDGNLDRKGFMAYLVKEGRFKGDVVFAGDKVIGKTSSVTNSDSDVNLKKLNKKLNEVSDDIRNISLENGITVGMLIDSIDRSTGILSADELEKIYFDKTGWMIIYDSEDIVKLMKQVGNGIFDDVKFRTTYNIFTGAEIYATLSDVEPFLSNWGDIDYDSLNQYLVSEGKMDGLANDRDNVIHVHDGKKTVVDRKTLVDFIEKINISYESIDKQKYVFSKELYQIIENIKKGGDHLDIGMQLQLSLLQENIKKVLRIMEYQNASEKVKKMLKWTRDELPRLYDCLGDLVSEEAKEKLKYSARFFDSSEDYINYLKSTGISDVVSERSSGINCGGDIYTYIDEYEKCKMIHEGNHSLGNLGYYNTNAGLKEALTESFNHRIQKANGTSFPNYIAYPAGTNGIDTLMNAQLPGLTVSDFRTAYYVTHDLTDIKMAVDRIGGPGYFESEFLPAFNSVLIDSDDSRQTQKEKIDKVVSTLISTYRLQF